MIKYLSLLLLFLTQNELNGFLDTAAHPSTLVHCSISLSFRKLTMFYTWTFPAGYGHDSGAYEEGCDQEEEVYGLAS